MAEAATATAPTQASAEAPASSAPSTTADVTSWAKQEAARLETESVSIETPAESAPDSSVAPVPTENEADTSEADEPSPQQEQPKLSRRERDEQRRQEIRAELETEFKAAQEREKAERDRQDAEQSLLTLIEKAEAGDYNAARQLGQIVKGQIETPKQTAREAQVWQRAQQEILTQMSKDFAELKSIDGVSEDDFATLQKAPTAAQFGKSAIDLGRKLERSALESRLATLEAENTSLKGQLAARGPSPLSANGAGNHAGVAAGRDMRSIAAQVAAELGISI